MSTSMEAELPTVAIVGRPNVGKSTLFNRIAGRRVAIVEEQPGVTRDRKEIEVDWLGRPFRLVDTGGWLPGSAGIDAKVSAQAERAMRAADVIIMLVDGTSGITDEDAQVAAMLRRLDRPVLLAVNKIDNPRREVDIWEFVALGLGDPHPVSALHGPGAADLLDRVVERLPELTATEPAEPVDSVEPGEPAEAGAREDDDDVVAVAIVGRPNVGKSTLFNRLIGEERAVVHDLPGTTRDSIDTVVDTDEGPIRFVDTAGMRRRSRIDEGTEYYSLVRALRSVDEADVALLVIDATDGVTHQDQRLAERVDAAGCPVVVLLNKWDAVDPESKDEIVRQVGRKLRFLGEAPVLRISAANGRGVHRLVPAVGAALDAYHRRVPTRKVNDVVQAAQAAQPAPHGGRILYATQGATDPPTFTLFTNRELPKSYLRYIERRLREEFDLGATAVKLRVRRRS
jgi:GTP-binding protein